MSIIIIGKVIGASIGASLIAVGAWYMADPTTIDNWMSPLFSAEVYGFLTETSAAGQSSLGTTSIDGKTLQCKIEPGTTFECAVKEVSKIADNKKSILLQDFLTRPDSERRLIDITSAFVAKKLYQIKDTKLNFKDMAWQTKPIKVFDVSDTSSETKTELGSITPMFMLQGRSTTFAGKTNTFVGQALAELSYNSSYKCSWDKNATDFKDCTIMPFVENDAADVQSEDAKITDLTFTTNSALTENKKITKHHYYLIQFTYISDSKELKDFVDTEIIYAKDSTSSNQITFGKLSAVQVVGDQLLILK